MKKTSFFVLAVFTCALLMTPVSADASKVGEIIKVNTPPGTVEHIDDRSSDIAQDAMPYWDEDLPNSDDRTH